MAEQLPQQSKIRLRIGVFFILLWWLPVWLLAPTISDLLGYGVNSSQSHKIFVALVVIQTIFGVLGIIIASREIITLAKSVPKRKVPKAFFHVLWSGNTDSLTK
jgi:hypothetical protein